MFRETIYGIIASIRRPGATVSCWQTRLVVNKCNLLCNTLHHEFEFELKILAGEDSIVVFFDVGRCAFLFGTGHVRQRIREDGHSILDVFDFLLLRLEGIL